MSQADGLHDLEVICVNDGSSDDTLEKLEYWAAKRPDVIRIISQENGGLSDARNTGLAAANGLWVNFPDPDDYLGERYLYNVRKALRIEHPAPLLATCTKLIFYFEDTDRISDTHPLTWRFNQPINHRTTNDMGPYIHLAANTCWLRLEDILKHNLTFDGHGWGCFEDAHLINRLFMLENERTVSFVKEAHYYYRKRQNATSLVDTAKIKKSYWLSQMEDGYLDLIKKARNVHGNVPLYVQRTVLYEMMVRIHTSVRDPNSIHSVLTKKEFEESKKTFHAIIDGIDAKIISNFELGRCYEEHKTGLLSRYKGLRRKKIRIYLKSHNPKAETMRFSWYEGGDDNITIKALVNGQPSKGLIMGTRQTYLYDEPYYQEKFIDVPIKLGDSLQWQVEGGSAVMRFRGRPLNNEATWLDLVNALRTSRLDQNGFNANFEARK